MKKNQQPSSNTVEQLRQQFEQQNLQEQGATGGEPLYAKVNKPPKQQRPQGPEESGYASPRAPEAAPQTTQETIYAPQKPLGNPYDRPPMKPSNGQQATKLVDPYHIGDLSKLGSDPDFQQRNNPLYESVGGGAGGGRKPEENLYADLDWSPKGRSPTKPVESVYATVGGGAQGGRNPQSPEHLYSELEFGPNGGRSPTKPVESVYATVGGGATGGQAPQQQDNPLYEGVGTTGRTTPPPRTQQDVMRTKMMQNPDFQYTLLEFQERCAVVFGNRHAMNEQLSTILNDPKKGEDILNNLLENPEGHGKLAGKVVFGIKSPDRRAAENEFSALCSSLEKHIETAQKLHSRFTREQEREQRGHSREGSPEGQEHGRHHRRHHSPERGEHSPEQQTRGRQSPEQGKGGIAFAM